MELSKKEIENRFKRCMNHYDDYATVQKVVAEKLFSLVLKHINYIPENILEIGCGTGMLTSHIKRKFSGSDLYVNDLVGDMCYRTGLRNMLPTTHCLVGDVERLRFHRDFDLILSASAFQWLQKPKATFERLAKLLEKEDLMFFSTFGRHNMREVKIVSGYGLKYPGLEEIEKNLGRYFDIEYFEEEFRVLEFDSALDVLQHLRKTGVNASYDNSIWTKSKVEHFVDEYNKRYLLDGKVTLTYHPIYVVCRLKEKPVDKLKKSK